MNAKTDRWELYTDRLGRRHWRWPSPDDAKTVRVQEGAQHRYVGVPDALPPRDFPERKGTR